MDTVKKWNVVKNVVLLLVLRKFLYEPMIDFNLYTAKNVTDLLLVDNFTGFLKLVNKLQQTCQFHLLMLKSSVKIRLVATCRLQTCYNL